MEKRIAVLLCAVSFVATAFAQTERHRAVRSGEPTSEELIAHALAAGTINAEQALTYRVFAAFGDCRLPSQFQGDDSNMDTTFVLDEVAATFSTLSPAAQSALDPYLREPYDTGGWVEAQQAACGSGKTELLDIHPKNITILGGKVGVNYLPGYEAAANRVANDVAFIYQTLVALMKTDPLRPREPLPYDPTGKDPTHLRIWIVAGKQNFRVLTAPLRDSNLVTCSTGPVFIEIGPSALKEQLAFSVMVAIVDGYPVATQCKFPEYAWLIKATATWAVDYVYPESDWEHRYADAFLTNPERPLEFSEDGHAKGAYLLPFYIVNKFTDAKFVPAMWEAAATKLSLPAVDDALAVQGGFEQQWPEFALRNLNVAPYNDYEKWDRLTSGTYTAEHLYPVPEVGEEPDTRIEMADKSGRLSIAPLSAQYFYFSFSPTVRSVAFLNGLNFKLSNRVWSVSPDFGQIYVFDNASKSRKGLKIQALVNINGAWETTPRDWTQTPFVSFCREVPAERLDELLIIYSNSNYNDREPITAEDLMPTLAASNMGCSGWKTEQATFEETDGGAPLKMTWSAAFRRTLTSLDYGPMPTLPPEGTPVLYILYSGSGDLTWSVGSKGGCAYAGSGTIPLDLLDFETWNFTPPGALLYRAYSGLMKSSQMVHFTRTCASGSPEPSDQYLPIWAVFPPFEVKTVNQDGITIHDEHLIDFDSKGKIQWTFTTNPP